MSMMLFWNLDFPLMVIWEKNPEVHLVLGAYQNENLGEDYFAEFEFEFFYSHAEL